MASRFADSPASLLALLTVLISIPEQASAQAPPPDGQLWSAISTMDVLAAARSCSSEPGCTSFAGPDGLMVDPSTGQPLLSVHAKGAMDVGPLLDWAATTPGVVLDSKLVHVFDMTGHEVDISMDLLDTDAWEGLRAAAELVAQEAWVSLHGVPSLADGLHPELAAAHGEILTCGGDPDCLQALRQAWPWLDAELGIGALHIEAPHDGSQHDAIAAELESLDWAEPPWVFAIDHADGDHRTRAVGRMPSTQLDGLQAWLGGRSWSASTRPLTEDELSMVRVRLSVAELAAVVSACNGDVSCHHGAGLLHQAVVSPGGRVGVLFFGEDPDVEGLNGLEYPGWSAAPAGYFMDGAAGLLSFDALRDVGLGRWNLGEALSVGVDESMEAMPADLEDYEAAWGPEDAPWGWSGDDDDSAGDDDDSAGDDDDSAAVETAATGIGLRLYRLATPAEGWDYSRLRESLQLRLPEQGTRVATVIDQEWLITTGAASDDLILEIAPETSLITAGPMDQTQLDSLGTSRPVGLAWNSLLGFEELRWMDGADLQASLDLLGTIEAAVPEGFVPESEAEPDGSSWHNVTDAGGSAFNHPWPFEPEAGGFVIPSGMSATEMALRMHAQAGYAPPLFSEGPNSYETSAPDSMIPVAGAGGNCATVASTNPYWNNEYSWLAQDGDSNARLVMDWGRYSPNIELLDRDRQGFSDYVGGQHRVIQVFAKGSDDWSGPWGPGRLDTARSRAILAALRLGDFYDQGYVHATAVDVDQLVVEPDSSESRLRRTQRGDAELFGPWGLEFEPTIADALTNRYSTPWFDESMGGDNGDACDPEESNAFPLDRFECLIQGIRVSLGDDFVHLAYVIQGHGADNMLSDSDGNPWCQGGCSKVGRPYSITVWEDLTPGVHYNKRVMFHEIGHDLGSKDEYSADHTDGLQCDSQFGYLGRPHDNYHDGCDTLGCTYMGCNLPSNNVRLENDRACSWSRAQMGLSDQQRGPEVGDWVDWTLGGDCVYDVHDSDPAAFLREAPLFSVALEMDTIGASFFGDDPFAQAEQYLADHQILENGELVAAWTWVTFPGYAFDCGVEKNLQDQSSRWAITINEVVSIEARYVGPAASIPEESGYLDGQWHPLDRQTVGPTSRYSFNKVGLTLRYPATIVDVPSTPQILDWAAPPQISAHDFEVRVLTDTGNTSYGVDPFTCDGSDLITGGGGFAMSDAALSAPVGPYLLANADGQLLAERGLREMEARLIAEYGSLDAVPALQMAWITWRSQLDDLGLQEGVDFVPPVTP